MNPEDITSFVEQRKWIPLAALAIHFVVRLLKADTKFFPTIPGTARIWAAFTLGVVSGILEKVSENVTWTSAIVGGLFSAAIAIMGHDVVVGSLRGGKEIPVPGLMIPGAQPAPGKPVTVPPEPIGDVTPVVLNDPNLVETMKAPSFKDEDPAGPGKPQG